MVFARSLYDKPLSLQGEFSTDDEGGARNMALDRFGAQWVELSLIPESEVRWVLRSDENAHDEESTR
jgi:hypothetical protein